MISTKANPRRHEMPCDDDRHDLPLRMRFEGIE